MKEYHFSRTRKAIIAAIFMPCTLLFGRWAFTEDGSVQIGVSVLFALFFLFPVVNSFLYKLRLNDEYIKEKNLFRTKKILFRNIDRIEADGFATNIRSGRKTINLGRFTDGFDEITNTVFAEITRDSGIVFSGDPIVIQSYFDKVAPSKMLSELAKPAGLENNLSVLKAQLAEKRWLFRAVDLMTNIGTFRIVYFGKGMGYECVLVNDELMVKADSFLWYSPTLAFKLKGIDVSVNVRIYPWFTIRKFWIDVNHQTVYSEK